jgi:hypothetical protein
MPKGVGLGVKTGTVGMMPAVGVRLGVGVTDGVTPGGSVLVRVGVWLGPGLGVRVAVAIGEGLAVAEGVTPGGSVGRTVAVGSFVGAAPGSA